MRYPEIALSKPRPNSYLFLDAGAALCDSVCFKIHFLFTVVPDPIQAFARQGHSWPGRLFRFRKQNQIVFGPSLSEVILLSRFGVCFVTIRNGGFGRDEGQARIVAYDPSSCAKKEID